MHVEVFGEGPDMFLLHGWALHGGMWGPWLDDLANRARLHVLDLPGHGRSEWSENLRRLGDLTQAVSDLVPSGAVILGWSLGGMVALELAARADQRAAGLILVASTPCFVQNDTWRDGIDARILDEFALGLTDNYRRTINNFLALQVRGDDRASETLRAMRRDLVSHGDPDPRALEAGLAMLRDSDLRTILPRVEVPALVLNGDRDRLTPASAGQAMARALPDARYQLIEGAGHAPFLSHPAAVTAEVDTFLAQLPQAAAAFTESLA